MKKRTLTATWVIAAASVGILAAPAAPAANALSHNAEAVLERSLTEYQQGKEPNCGTGTGTKYMVVSANPNASLAGCAVLKNGGSAIDAAVAVQAALTVVEPQASGLGGGSLLTYYDAKSKTTHVFDGLSAAGNNVTDALTTPTDDDILRHGIVKFDDSVGFTARAVGVPGTVSVLGAAHDRFGKTRWKKLFEDPIRLAKDGFPLAPYTHQILGSAATTPLCSYPDIRGLYCDGQSPKAAGSLVKNPELAALFEEVRDGGHEAFYDPNGTIAPAIVDKLRAGPFDATADAQGPAVIPSLLTAQDFANYQHVEREPLCTERLGRQLCTTPAPSTGGATVTNLLGMAEIKGVASLAPDTVDYSHLMIEASRIAGVDARAYIGDPAFDGPAPTGLTTDDYIAARAELIHPDTSVHPVIAGNPAPAESLAKSSVGGSHDDTSQVAIVDKHGNALSMTTTINQNFGSRVAVRGMMMNNVYTNFSSEPGSELNEMEPNKRPRTTIAPSIVFDAAGKVSAVVGSAGGGPIPDYIAQAILGLTVYGETPAQALARPHVSGQTRLTNCGGLSDVASDVEAGTSAANLLPALTEREAPCPRAVTLRSGAGAIKINSQGHLEGAADPRRDGAALGR